MSKVPLVVGLQKIIQAIKNWLPFTPGENTTTYAPYGVNFGTNSIIGIKGYRIIGMQPAREVLDDAENVLVEEGGTYTLELEPGETIDERILGQEYTIYIKATSERVGIIEKIEGNVVTVKPFYWPNDWPDHIEDIGEGEEVIPGQQYYYDNSFFICDAVPDAGNKYFGEGAYAEGYGTRAYGFVTHAEGNETLALGKAAHTEGIETYAGYAGHAQNKNTKAIGLHAHAQNYYTTAKGDNSDAGGYGTKARGKNSVTRGEYTEADGKNGVANGWKTKAIGDNSDAGGYETETEGLYSFGRGYQNKAKHKGSALFGRNNTSSREMQFLAGQFADTSDKNIMAAVGVGTADNSRKNGLAVYADGRVRAGKGGTSGNDLITVDQLNNTYFPQNTKVISTSNSEGWYQIAKGSNIKTVSGIFKVTAQIQAGGLWSEIIFVASKAFNADGKVTIINEQAHTNGAAINDVRLRYTNNTANSDVYVDVHCKNNNNSATDTVTISVELIDSTKTDKLAGGLWNLTDIVQEPSTGWTYAKQINAKKILAINSDGTGSIQTPSSPSDDNIANVGFVDKENKSLINEFMSKPHVWASQSNLKTYANHTKLFYLYTFNSEFVFRPKSIDSKGMTCETISAPEMIERYIMAIDETQRATNFKDAYIEFPGQFDFDLKITISAHVEYFVAGQLLRTSDSLCLYQYGDDVNDGDYRYLVEVNEDTASLHTYPLPLSVTDPIKYNNYSAVNVRTMNKAIEPLDQRLSFLEGGLLEYNGNVDLEYTFGEHPDGAETGWCYYSPIKEGNPYTKVRLESIFTDPTLISVENTTVSYIDGVSADGTKRERLFTLDEATRQQIFNFVTQHEETIDKNAYWLSLAFQDSYVEVRIRDYWENTNIIESTQIPYSIPTNLIFDCKDYAYLDFNNIDHVVEPIISISKLGFKKES